MPPQQCPECGRFLRKDLIALLADGPQACPRCEAPLLAESFGLASSDEVAQDPPLADEVIVPVVVPVVDPVAADVNLEAIAVEETPETETEPELAPEPVKGRADDPLAGWDPQGYEARTTEVLQAEDNTSVMAAGGAATGALVGLGALGRTRGRGALLGALVGAVTGAVVGRMTRPHE